MKVVVTGSRDWKDTLLLDAVLERYFPCFVHVGDCKTGADAAAWAWAERRAYGRQKYYADWDAHGKAAGPLRNREMLDTAKPEIVLAFKEGKVSKGTDDCIKAALERSIPVVVIQWNDVIHAQ